MHIENFAEPTLYESALNTINHGPGPGLEGVLPPPLAVSPGYGPEISFWK